MSEQGFYGLILLIVVAGFVWEQYLRRRNAKHFGDPLPPETQDIYDAEQYRKSMAYKRENFRFGLVHDTVSFVLLLLMLVFKGFGRLYDTLGNYFHNEWAQMMAYFGILYLASFLISLPFSWYAVFRIEEKYGFNRSSMRLFVLDKIKSLILTVLFGASILSVIWLYYRDTGKNFWIWAWLFVSGISILTSMFYTDIIVPWFNKLTPLPEGELRDALEKLARETGFRLRNIYVMDAGKRSTKANAYFSGLGPRKKIVLFDTLIEQMQPDEIAAVMAHEIGHYKHRHILRQILLSVVVTGLMLYLLSLVIDNETLARALGAKGASFAIGLTAFALLYEPFTVLTGWLTNSLSRRFEFQADAYAARYGYGEPLIGALRKLAARNLSNLTPDRLYVQFHYSHPPLDARIRMLKKKSI